MKYIHTYSIRVLLSPSTRIIAVPSSVEVLAEGNWTQNVTTRLKEFEHTLLKAMKQQGWDGVEGGEAVNWTFMGSLFYAITVITTIGYGHIAPKTAAAKIVTIFYAILGIPLTVLCWSNIGDAMANAFRWAQHFLFFVCCCLCFSLNNTQIVLQVHLLANLLLPLHAEAQASEEKAHEQAQQGVSRTTYVPQLTNGAD